MNTLQPKDEETDQKAIAVNEEGEKQTTLIAVSDYGGRIKGSIPLKSGDKVKLLEDSDEDQWRVRHENGKEGYIPWKCVVQETDCFLSQDWFFGNITQEETERKLLQPGLENGTFLIRQRENIPGAYILSIRDPDAPVGGVTHFKIFYEKDGWHITPQRTFATLFQLVESYKETPHILHRKLRQPCPKHVKASPSRKPAKMPPFEIRHELLSLDRQFDSGIYTDLWEGTWNKSVKVTIMTPHPGTTEVETFMTQIQILKKCKHSSIVRLRGYCRMEERLCIVTEFMSNNTLLSYLREGAGKNPNDRTIMDMAAQVADGLSYLEKMKIIHRDIAARNILVGVNNDVKIAGFDQAVEGDEYKISEIEKFPIRWSAPEVLQYAKFTAKSVVWAYGILLTELVTRGGVPYTGMKNLEVVSKLSEGYRMPRPGQCPEPVYDVMLTCWDKDEEKRPTFDFLFSFFTDFNAKAEIQHETKQ